MGRVVSEEEITGIAERLHREQKLIVFTNGVFDMLHPGHIGLLEHSKKQGDVLMVGINSDVSTRKFKGPLRPIYDQDTRSKLLAALGCVDYVTIYEDDDPKRLMELIKPNIWTKCITSKEQQDRFDGECKVIERYGGKGFRLPAFGNYSATDTINKIMERYCK